MSLLNELQKVLNRLAPLGWGDWFLNHGLDIQAADLEKALTLPLGNIKRNVQGMQDYSNDGKRGVEAGRPGLSLIYHALASAQVHPTADGSDHNDLAAYPTISELDAVENYIYSLAKRPLSSFSNPVVAVFAYQYRIAENSPHQKHADLGFSRCGVARIGTEAPRYDGPTRSFTSTPEGDGRGAARLPARYGAFIAERHSVSQDVSVFRPSPIDGEQDFLFPAHKLFAGDECLLQEDGTPMSLEALDFKEYHINEKLRRIHTDAPDNPDFIPPLAIFDIDKFPFVRDSNNDPQLIQIDSAGDSILLQSGDHQTLTRTATQTVEGKNEIVRFKVPAATRTSHRRFFSSLTFAAPNGRAAPEYANIRHEVVGQSGAQQLQDLNVQLSTDDFNKKVIEQGGYETAHFIDDSCDGSIAVNIEQLTDLPNYCAYSLVTAVDFFPKIRQLDIQRWVEQLYSGQVGLTLGNDTRLHFKQGGPRPLSDGRFATSAVQVSQPTQRTPNSFLPHPVKSAQAFTRLDKANFTTSAIVGDSASGAAFDINQRAGRALSWLPDAAADVFAPGWDISTHIVQGHDTYASYGLGSPFLEDAKLCAALNSFWPAAAPDSSRTFNVNWSPTSQPLMDDELGYHPEHPCVKNNEATTNRGWDGEYGPFMEQFEGANYVNAAHKNRSDYVSNALAGFIGFNGLDKIEAYEMIQRMDVLRLCFEHLQGQSVTDTALWLVSAKRVDDWANYSSTVLPRADSSLTGAGYIYQFAVVDNESETEVKEQPVTRVRLPLTDTVEFQISAQQLLFNINSGQWVKRTVAIELN